MTPEERAAIEKRDTVWRNDPAFVRAADYHGAGDREALLEALRVAEATLLQVATEAGEDTSDIDNPRQLVHPTIGEFALQAVRQLRADYDETLSDVDTDLAELRATFDLRWKADQRAIKQWQFAHPGTGHMWPDHADLVVWLLGENDRLAKTALTLARDRLRLM